MLHPAAPDSGVAAGSANARAVTAALARLDSATFAVADAPQTTDWRTGQRGVPRGLSAPGVAPLNYGAKHGEAAAVAAATALTPAGSTSAQRHALGGPPPRTRRPPVSSLLALQSRNRTQATATSSANATALPVPKAPPFPSAVPSSRPNVTDSAVSAVGASSRNRSNATVAMHAALGGNASQAEKTIAGELGPVIQKGTGAGGFGGGGFNTEALGSAATTNKTEANAAEPRTILGLPKIFWALVVDILAMLCFVACIPLILCIAKRKPTRNLHVLSP